MRAIMPASEIISKNYAAKDQEYLRASKLIDPKRYPFSVEINIYGHSKISLMDPKEQLGITIESTEIYKTMRLIFELIWDHLPEIAKT